MVSQLKLTLLKKEKIAKNVWLFRLKRPKNFIFFPGQYIRIFDPVLGQLIFRDFTIASSPFNQQTLDLILKEGVSDYKKNLFAVKEGKEILVNAPMGRFYLENTENSELVFLAGGVGISPFYSMLQYIQKKKLDLHVTLIVSFSSFEESIFYEELEKFSADRNVLIIPTFTKSVPKNWKGNVGRISKELIKKYMKISKNKNFWICGSPTFVNDMESMLLMIGVSLENIRTEIFLGF